MNNLKDDSRDIFIHDADFNIMNRYKTNFI